MNPAWPELPYRNWADTIETLHLWSQIVGKIRMQLTPWVNHSWSVPLYVTARGLTTSPIPYGGGTFEIDFDFLGHQLSIFSSDGEIRTLGLDPMSVATFYARVFDLLHSLGIEISINTCPCELAKPIHFPDDEVHGAYDRGHVESLHRALVSASRVMYAFRARFIGKVSPVHLFWGAFDLAVTRFSGRTAPIHPGGIPNLSDAVTREAYSHEVSSCGFWVGNREAPAPVFYAYAYPTPKAFPDAQVRPETAIWVKELGEFVLPYDAVQQSSMPDAALDDFFESTYAAAADLAGWDRKSLERPAGYRPAVRRDAAAGPTGRG